MKKFLMFISLVLLGFTVVSCKDDVNPYENPDVNYSDAEVPEITNDDISVLNGLEIDTLNAKTTFYQGEVFDSKGLMVNALYYDEEHDTTEKVDVSDKVMVDGSAFDSTKVGTYSIKVTYDSGTERFTSSYDVEVLDIWSLATKPYAVGLEISIDKSETLFNAKEDLELTHSTLEGTVIYNTGQSKSVTGKLVVDVSNVNTLIKGVYEVVVSYSEPYTINNINVSNTVKNYYMVEIDDTLKGIEFVSGTLTASQYTSLNTKDWVVEAVYEHGGRKTITDFTASADTSKAGKSIATISYVEEGVTYTCEVEITVNETIIADTYMFNANDLALGNYSKGEAWLPDTDNPINLVYMVANKKAFTVDANKKSIDGYSFTQRLKTNGKGDATDCHLLVDLSFFDSANTYSIVVYAMSGSSSADRPLVLENSLGETESIVLSGTAIGKAEFVMNLQGGSKYYLYSGDSSMSIYGIIITKEVAA